MNNQRVDKWIWHARVVKTRTLAQKLVASGKVRIDKNKSLDPSRKISVGNILTITLPNEIKIYEVLGFSDKRGPYTQARQLYEDLSPPAPTSRTNGNEIALGAIKVGPSPSKRDRQIAIRLKQNSL